MALSASHALFDPTDEHRQLRALVAQFARDEVDPQAAEYDARGVLNTALMRRAGALGLLGVSVPERDGGAGMDAVAAVIVHHELAKYDPGFCLAYLAHAMLFVNNFYHCANETQRRRWLPNTLTGEWVAGMGMTEPGAGTDVLGMATTAVRDGDGWVVNGTKTYITNACEGFCFLVYAKVDGAITAFVVDRDCPGFSTSAHIDKLGMRASTMSELVFEDSRVPAENLLGQVGGGAVHMMRNLEIERVTLAAMSVGIAERCVEIMIRYSTDRRAFGRAIAEFGQIQRYIADAYAAKEAAKSLVYNVARDVGPGRRARVGSDAAKLFAAPVGKMCADYAMQVMGGAGYGRGFPGGRLWRDAKLPGIGGGALGGHRKTPEK